METKNTWSVGITSPLIVFRFIEEARIRHNIEVYAPSYTKQLYIRKMNKTKDVVRPAFGGYIFVNIQSDQTIYLLNRLMYMFTMLKCDGEYVSLRSSEILRLKKMEEHNHFNTIEEDITLQFKAGCILLITNGSFIGKKAKILEDISSKSKIVVAEIEGKKLKIPLYFFRELKEGLIQDDPLIPAI